MDWNASNAGGGSAPDLSVCPNGMIGRGLHSPAGQMAYWMCVWCRQGLRMDSSGRCRQLKGGSSILLGHPALLSSMTTKMMEILFSRHLFSMYQSSSGLIILERDHFPLLWETAERCSKRQHCSSQDIPNCSGQVCTHCGLLLLCQMKGCSTLETPEPFSLPFPVSRSPDVDLAV